MRGMLGGSDTLDTFNTTGNNNDRLLMVPHFIRAQSPYKDVSIIMFISSHTHSHTTNTCITGHGLV